MSSRTVEVRFVEVGRSHDHGGVTSNLGSPTEPWVVELGVGDGPTLVGLSQGSGHLGGGGAFPAHRILTMAGELKPSWVEHFTRADAMWTMPYLRRVVAGERVDEAELVEAYRHRHGRDPVVRQGEVVVKD